MNDTLQIDASTHLCPEATPAPIYTQPYSPSHSHHIWQTWCDEDCFSSNFSQPIVLALHMHYLRQHQILSATQFVTITKTIQNDIDEVSQRHIIIFHAQRDISLENVASQTDLMPRVATCWAIIRRSLFRGACEYVKINKLNIIAIRSSDMVSSYERVTSFQQSITM